MNKYLFILGLVGTALLSACSSDDLMTDLSPEEERALVVEASQDSDVPITLGVASSRGVTRGPLTGGDFSTEDGKYLGVFCLATGYQASYEDNHPIANKWKDDNTGLLVRMSNVPASVLAGNVIFKNSEATANQTYYYPMGNWMKYNFYAYYPWKVTTASSPSISDNTVVEVNYEIDGTHDIIWGKTTPPAGDAFSAKYFREIVPSETPQFNFEHKLVQFRFFVKAADSDVATNVKITNMYISNAIYKLKLIVADKREGIANKNGELRTGDDPFRNEMNIKQLSGGNKDENRFDGTIGNALDITTDDVDLNAEPVGYLMLPKHTVYGQTEKYQLCLNWAKKVDDVFIEQVDPIRYELNDDFAEGKIYNIVVTVNPEP